MLGSTLDKIFVACSSRRGKLSSEIQHYSHRCADSNQNWVCFIPEFCFRVPYFRKCLIREKSNIDLYILPKTTVQPNPELTKKFLDTVLSNAIQIQNREFPTNKVNVVGISLGNVLAFKFAENFHVDKFYSVVPGSRLAECIWESIATNKIARDSGRSFPDYKNILAQYNPIESLPKLAPVAAEIHLGLCDQMIPYRRGAELVQEMKSKSNIKVKYRKYSGHVETVISFLINFQKSCP